MAVVDGEPLSRVKASREKTPRRKLFYLHSWLGFNLALFMSLVIFTGTVAVIADEIDWLFHPEMRVQPGVEKVSWGQLEQAARTYAPTDTLTILSAGEADYFAHRATMVDTGNKRYYLYIDQWTGKVTGTNSALTVQRFFRDLHRYLFMPSIAGLPLVTTMAVVLLISLYTGLKTTRNWGTIATRVRFNKGARVAVGDFHKAMGLWSSWFLLLIVITSFWYFAELSFAVGGTRFEPGRPGVTADRVSSYGLTTEFKSASQFVEIAENALPGFEATEVQFATSLSQAVTVLGRHDDLLVRKRANRIFLDPADGSIIKVQKSSEIGWVAYLNELADPLHFGSFGKLTTKLIWFVFGTGLFLLSVTGVYLTWKRVKTATPTLAQLANLPVFVLAIVFGYPYINSYLDDGLPEKEIALAKKLFDDLNVSVMVAVDEQGKATGMVRILVASESGRLNLEPVTVSLNSQFDYAMDISPRYLDSHVTLIGHLPADVLSNSTLISISLTSPSGEEMSAEWDLLDSRT